MRFQHFPMFTGRLVVNASAIWVEGLHATGACSAAI